MKKQWKAILCGLIGLSLVLPFPVHAREGDCGYEGGISSGEAPNKTSFDYQEMCFISGEPILLKGTLSLKKSLKQDTLVSTYNYSLKNTDKAATLTRTLMYSTKIIKKDNGQTIEETTLTGNPMETVKIDDKTYVLRSYDFTRSRVVDPKPAIDYYAGNTWGKKTYQMGGAGGAANGGNITVEVTGNFYGYDQYWGSSQAITLNYILQSETKNGANTDRWGGTARVTLSSNMSKQIKYIDNIPDEISFEGGYVQTQYNESIMEYTCKLPEFDKNGVSTDLLVESKDNLKIETFPVWTRLPVPNLKHLRGHWAHNDINALYSLEVYKGNDAMFNPEKYMTRAEFTKAMVKAAEEVPLDPTLVNRNQRTPAQRTNNNEEVGSPFSDIPTDSIYFEYIQTAYKRGLINGVGKNLFDPDSVLTVADAITIFIRALGLEGMAPNPRAVTVFKDNDQIPGYARNAVYVAHKIGLVKGDDRGYLKPNEGLTNSRASAFINRFIDYMRDGIRKDYRDRIVNYS